MTPVTPRTDAFKLQEHVAADFLWERHARQLEVELIAATELCATYCEQRADAMRAQAALHKDYLELADAVQGEGVFVNYPPPVEAARQLHAQLAIIQSQNLTLNTRIDELKHALQDAREAKNRFKSAASGLAAENIEETEVLHAKIKALERWKEEQLAVEAQWDAQAVGKLLGVPLGADIRPQIQPRVQELLNEIHDNLILIDQLRATLANYQ